MSIEILSGARSAKEGCTLSARRKVIVDRSTSIPFSYGALELKLTLTGPAASTDDAERMLDNIFAKAMSLAYHGVVPAINGIQDQIEVGEGETRAETLIELEVLGNDIKLDITTVLPSIGVDTELVRAWVAKIVGADFVGFALKVITSDALNTILDSGRIIFREDHAPPILGLVIAEHGARG